MIKSLKETNFLGNSNVLDKLEDFGFEDSGDGFYDYFIPFSKYCACVNLDDMGAFIEDDNGMHMRLPFMRGQERVRLTGTTVDEFLDFVREIEYEADSVGGDISYMFESRNRKLFTTTRKLSATESYRSIRSRRLR